MDLLGYTMNYARREFKYMSRLNDFDTGKFSFEQLAEALERVDITAISADYGEGEDFGSFFSVIYSIGLGWKTSRRSSLR